MNRSFEKFYYFHPLLWYALGYSIWMFIPPFFTERGHHSQTLIADFIGSIFIIMGYLMGSSFKKRIFGNYKFRIKDNDLNTLLLAFFLIIYSVRIKLYLEIGVYAFLHPYSRESSLLDTIATILSMPYIILIMTLFYIRRKRIYIFLFLMELIFYIIPSMSRSFYILVPLYFTLIIFFYGKTPIRLILVKAAPVLILALVFISLVGPYINSVRSYAQIGKYEKGLDLDFNFEDNKTDFIIKRLNIHAEAFHFEPVINKGVEMDILAFESMAEKWLGFTSGYKMNPTGISTQLGIMIGYGEHTATDIPRNFTLINYPYPLLALSSFNILFGLIIAFNFGLIFAHNNLLFIMLWIPFVYSPMFSSGGAFPSTFVFQYIFIFACFVLLFIVFKIIMRFKALFGNTIPHIKRFIINIYC